MIEGDFNSIIGFAEGLPEEELILSRKVAKSLDLKHHEAILKPKDTPKMVTKLAHHISEPIGDTAATTAELAAEKAKGLGDLIFAGNGGDELFAGYDRYRLGFKYQKIIKLSPESVRRKLRSSPKASGKYIWSISTCEPNFINGLIPKYNLQYSKKVFNEFFINDKEELIKNYMWADINSHMVYDQLFLMDQTFQYHNIYCRYPILDINMLKHAFRIPIDYNLTKTNTRVMQRKWLSDILKVPDEIVKRKKQGFGAPIDVWMESALYDFSNKVIFESKLIADDLFKENDLRKLLFEQSKINKINSVIYYFLILSLWLDSLPKQIGEEL
jgi:asparagine synthase (glutamine-hydrolysing)